ncbi:MAG TPA: phosphodiester glycosidase family protein [Chitinophagaceae bacterium]|nr:phosphodiester glycosidase family protein [Chitinophagaceae bacterium]
MNNHSVVLRISVALCGLFLFVNSSYSQLKWQNVDSLYQPLPPSVHVYFTNEKVDTGMFRAYYLVADLKDKKLDFTVDTALDRRLTPSKFFERDDHPLVVVNTTFFSYETNRSLNVVIRDGKLLGYNIHTVAGRGKDTLTYKHPFGSAIGIKKNRDADIAWTYTDSSLRSAYAVQTSKAPLIDSLKTFIFDSAKHYASVIAQFNNVSTNVKINDDGSFPEALITWKVETAVGGGPVLLQKGEINITNNKELKFVGKAIDDKHPRTAMGYTKDGKLIILMIEGRNKQAGGATLTQEARIFKDLGCWEALNLDGGGSSCLLVNGKETIKVSDAAGQRPVPAVFIIQARK